MNPNTAKLIISLALCTVLQAVFALPFAENATSLFTPCPSQCRFRFCESAGPSLLPMTLPDSSVTPAVCAHNFARVTLGATGEARIKLRPDADGVAVGYIPASQVKVNASGTAVSLSLAPTAFKAYSAHPADALGDGSSGLGTETMTGPQRAALHGACVRLPVLQWQITDFPGAEVRNGKLTNAETDCVAFRVARPRVEARLVWAQGGDLDLRVVRPSGETVFHAAARARDALYVSDSDGACAAAAAGNGGSEAVALVGGTGVVSGKYLVKVHRFRKCVAGEVGFTVEVWVDGQSVWTRNSVIGGGEADEYEMGWVVDVQL